MKRLFALLPVALAALVVAGCSKSETSATTEAKPAEAAPAEAAPAEAKPAEAKPAEAAPTAAADPKAEAAQIFKTRCVVCHGESGKGDGATAATLNPKPRDYTDAEWQKSVTDDQLAKVIVEGGAAVGKSPLMPPNPDLAGKPEVTKELVALIRAFGAK